MFNNLILNTDSYKTSHFLQYPPQTEFISSYIEPRGGQFKQALFFGLQAFIKEYLLKPISHADIDEAEGICKVHSVPFYREGWEHILEQHQGFLPLEIQALPEGMIVSTGTALVQVKNTDPHSYWLTSYIETALLRAVWYPTTVATISWHAKQIIKQYLDETSDSSEGLAFKLHDFGARGASSQESAALGGMAHLVNFMGTDTIAGLLAAKRYYQADMAGFSIPAAEHSTMTAWGKENEAEAYANMIKQFAKPNSLVAVVSDSYDIYYAVSNIWGKQLREQVEQSGGTLVIRPDSGKPADIVPEVLQHLWDTFGGTVNHKGYRMLPDCVRVIQGDGISIESLPHILEIIKQAGFSTDNVAFGMGAGLLQKVDRDTLSFAMKASAIYKQGAWHDVYKSPITDQGKVSKRGQQAVYQNELGIHTVALEQLPNDQDNLLRIVYRNGELLCDDGFELVRERSSG